MKRNPSLGLNVDLIILMVSIVLASFLPYTIMFGALFVFARLLYRSAPLKQPIYSFTNLIILLIVFWLYRSNGISNGTITNIPGWIITISSILMYLIGMSYGKYYQSGKDVLYIFFMLSIAFALPHLLLTIEDIFKTGLINPERHLEILDEDQRNTTQRVIELSLCLSAISFTFCNTKVRKSNKEINYFVLLSIIAFICSLHYVSRTGIALFGISLLLGFLLFRKKGTTFNITAVLLVIAAVAIFNNTAIGSIYAERETTAGASIIEGGGRFEKWGIWTALVLSNPGGIRELDSLQDFYGFAHNMWIDFGKYAGVASFFLLIFFSLRNVYHCVAIYFNKHVNDSLLKQLILIFVIIFFLANMTEPIHEGSPSYFYLYFFFCGITDVIYFQNRSRKIYTNENRLLWSI